MSLTVGVDIGGTAIKHGLVSAAGDIRADASVPTPATGGRALLDTVGDLIVAYRQEHDGAAVGVGTAGAVDHDSGTVVGLSPNIADWEGTAVRAELEQRTGLPVVVDNDANCMALAETETGAGAGARSVFFLTLGTGVGSAFVVDGQLWRGSHSMGGEFGHATIVKDGRLCACGQRGHLEAYASATALARRAVDLARQGLPSLYAGISDEAAAALGSKDVFNAAAGGDAAAAQAIAEMTAYLGTGIASAVNLLDPERVVIGGGMADAGRIFFQTLENEVRARVHAGVADYVSIVPARLGNRAGWLGAALLARMRRDAP